jgi:hypothetical protein
VGTGRDHHGYRDHRNSDRRRLGFGCRLLFCPRRRSGRRRATCDGTTPPRHPCQVSCHAVLSMLAGTVPIWTTEKSGFPIVASAPPSSATASARLRTRRNEQRRIRQAEHFDAAEQSPARKIDQSQKRDLMRVRACGLLADTDQHPNFRSTKRWSALSLARLARTSDRAALRIQEERGSCLCCREPDRPQGIVS